MTPDDIVFSDEELIDQLRRLRHELAAPAAVIAAATDAFRWRSVAVAVAGLEFDSLVDDDDQLARVRGSGAERRLRFASPGRSVEVAVVDNNSGLAGRVDPPVVGTMVLRHPDGSAISTPLDERGEFFFEAVGRGPVSLRPVLADALTSDFETEWVTI
ncbi:MAG TPA: hypothetical protein VEJ84_23975 [Acidimicrobiales bacterium]|nr:hypothetical protein [Acidimicrobiales bacterium]